MNGFPFDPEKLARLAALSRSINGAGAPPPIAGPTVIDEDGFIWLPAPDGRGGTIPSFVHPGLRLGWIPVPELGGVILSQWGGPGPEPEAESEEGITVCLTRDGLRRYVADLQAIDAQLGDG